MAQLCATRGEKNQPCSAAPRLSAAVTLTTACTKISLNLQLRDTQDRSTEPDKVTTFPGKIHKFRLYQNLMHLCEKVSAIPFPDGGSTLSHACVPLPFLRCQGTAQLSLSMSRSSNPRRMMVHHGACSQSKQVHKTRPVHKPSCRLSIGYHTLTFSARGFHLFQSSHQPDKQSP